MVVCGDLPRAPQVLEHRIPIGLVADFVRGVNDTGRLPDQGLGLRIEIEFERLRQVVFQGVIPVPLPSLDHLRVDQQIRLNTEQSSCVVPHPAALVLTVHGRGCRELFDAEVEIELSEPLHEFEVLQEPDFAERLELMGRIAEVVRQTASVFSPHLEFRVDVATESLVVAVVRREIPRIEHFDDADFAATAGAAACRTASTSGATSGGTTLFATTSTQRSTATTTAATPATAELRIDFHPREVDGAEGVF